MYRTEPHRVVKERLVRVRPLADARVIVPLAVVFGLAALVVFNAGSWTCAVRVAAIGTPPPSPAATPDVGDMLEKANDELDKRSRPGIFELDTDYRRAAFAPVASVEVEVGRFFEGGRILSSLYAWPTQARVGRSDGWASDGTPSSFTTILVTDATDDHAPVTTIDQSVGDAGDHLRPGQARVASDLDAWLAGPRTTPFVGRYGDVVGTLPHALAVAALGLFLVSLFLVPRIEVWRTATPSLVRLRHGFWRRRDLDLDVRDAERVAVRSVSRLGVLVHRLVLRRPGEADVVLVPFGTTSLPRAVAMRQRLVDGIGRAPT